MWQSRAYMLVVKLVKSFVHHQAGDEDDADEAADKLVTSHPNADTTILFITGEGLLRVLKLSVYFMQIVENRS